MSDNADELYAWLTVFVLPINSAVNPLIYTVMTPSFKRRLLERRRSQATIQPNTDITRPWYSLLTCACFRRLSKSTTAKPHIQGGPKSKPLLIYQQIVLKPADKATFSLKLNVEQATEVNANMHLLVLNILNILCMTKCDVNYGVILCEDRREP